MLAALLYGQEDLRLEEVEAPTPAAGEVVIRVNIATTCGTDLKVWRRGGHARMLKPPTLFGHEAAGQIVAVGEGVTEWRVGDRVVANSVHCALRHRAFARYLDALVSGLLGFWRRTSDDGFSLLLHCFAVGGTLAPISVAQKSDAVGACEPGIAAADCPT
ncbi:alcohol dehydrogenase catalytic domain-containing protein [Leptolyngbya sp. 7M]|uniref:alcohol dehydrogenase catalytic domain-containing protein n=1 Tax=Leptolyngbya sp. 7M TaxID=2812896 RepID=UPI001B8AC7BE|nr:alcohol dehydrogenase catalytic domain-containing protein [Leptolyngbya sp. 7M]QYO64245.1 alcohol dehydrogenase catalytic domain-containing protein [Leptolyngbya sp. 7M]